MITLITGVPGAGKTLYCIQNLLSGLAGKKQRVRTADGVDQDVEREVFTNINGLLLPHTKIEAGPDWTHDARAARWTQPEGTNRAGLSNWHEWAKPGAVIVYDEVQKPWPLAAAGSRVPPMIEALETHRHMGVDFIVLTQHPMLIHANVMRLVGRHLHVRRMGNMGLAVVYEWDSASRTLLYKNAMSKAPFRYSSKVFELYKSAEAHTKQTRRLPALIFVLGAALVLGLALGPSTAARIAERLNPAKPGTTAVAELTPGQGTAVAGARSPQRPASAPIAQVDSAPVVAVDPEMAGCVSMGDRCSCLTDVGKLVPAEPIACQAKTGAGRGPAIDVGSDTPRLSDRVTANGDAEMLRWMASRRTGA